MPPGGKIGGSLSRSKYDTEICGSQKLLLSSVKLLLLNVAGVPAFEITENACL